MSPFTPRGSASQCRRGGEIEMPRASFRRLLIGIARIKYRKRVVSPRDKSKSRGAASRFRRARWRASREVVIVAHSRRLGHGDNHLPDEILLGADFDGVRFISEL